MLLIISNNIYSQTETNDSTAEIESMHIDSFYENKSDYLIYSKIILLDSTKSGEIINRVKNWGGINFVNLKEVLVSETNDQLVFNYIDNSFFLKTFLTGRVNYKWYIRMVVQVKDNKVRVQLFDDGNVAVSGQYYLAARTYYLKNYFNKEDKTMCQKNFYEGFLSIKNAITSTVNNFETNINKPTSKKDDW